MKIDSRLRVRIAIIVLVTITFLIIYPNRQFFFSNAVQDYLWLTIIAGIAIIYWLLRGFKGIFEFLAGLKDTLELYDRVRTGKRELTKREMAINRDIMLQKVYHIWITEYLKNALPKNIYIKLGFISDPDQVTKSTAPIEWTTHNKTRMIRQGTPLISIFETEAAYALLILAKPGAGKTISLLQLASDLIKKAQHDDTQSIPVVFNLSSWADKQKPLAQWLEDQLMRIYDVPRRVGQFWIEHGELTLLLDGLDEIYNEQMRKACVEAINTYLRQHNLVKIAVCSRIDEYGKLITKLNLTSAIIIRDVRLIDAKQYLAGFGTQPTALQNMIQSDETLRNLVRSPLTLNILAVAAQEMSQTALHQLAADSNQARKELYDVYIQRMLTHRGVDKRYGTTKPKRWLAWLAFQMNIRSQKEFFIHTLQPDWLPNGPKKRVFFFLIYGLLNALIMGLAGALIFVAVGGLHGALVLGITGAIIFGAIGALYGGLSRIVHGNLDRGLIFWLVDKLFEGMGDEEISRIKGELRSRLLTHIKFVTHFVWKSDVWIIFFGVVFVRLIFIMLLGVALGFRRGLIGLLILGLIYGLSGGISKGLKQLSSNLISAEIPDPIQPIVRTRQFSIYLFLIFSVIGILFFGIVFGFVGIKGIAVSEILTGLNWNWQNALWSFLFGPLLGLLLVFRTGNALIIHWAIKKYLARLDLLAIDLIPFLNFSADRLLLIRTGGSYTFFHRSLHDYFSDMWISQQECKHND